MVAQARALLKELTARGNDYRRRMTRAEVLAAMQRRQPSVGRDDFLAELVAGRDVLDVGCVDHDAENAATLRPTFAMVFRRSD